MCRMIGMVGTVGSNGGAAQAAPSPLPPLPALPTWQHLVGAPHSLRIQSEAGCVPAGDAAGHQDSWGIGWFDEQGQVSLVRQTGSAAESAYFVFAAETAARNAAGSGPARTLIGHLRKASCGAVTSENAHPVRADYGDRQTLLLAHNGTVRPPLLAGLRDDLRAARREEAGSDSDTVALAGWLAARAEAGGDWFGILAESLRELLRRAESLGDDATKAYSALNLLVAHPDGLAALRQFSKDPDYYTLSARPLTGDEGAGWLVASEATDDLTGWAPLEPGRLTLFPTVAGAPVRTAWVNSR